MSIARRVIHPLQQGARLSWSDSLFELVESVPRPAAPLVQPLPVGEAREVGIEEFHRAQLVQALRQPGGAA